VYADTARGTQGNTLSYTLLKCGSPFLHNPFAMNLPFEIMPQRYNFDVCFSYYVCICLDIHSGISIQTQHWTGKQHIQSNLPPDWKTNIAIPCPWAFQNAQVWTVSLSRSRIVQTLIRSLRTCMSCGFSMQMGLGYKYVWALWLALCVQTQKHWRLKPNMSFVVHVFRFVLVFARVGCGHKSIWAWGRTTCETWE